MQRSLIAENFAMVHTAIRTALGGANNPSSRTAATEIMNQALYNPAIRRAMIDLLDQIEEIASLQDEITDPRDPGTHPGPDCYSCASCEIRRGEPLLGCGDKQAQVDVWSVRGTLVGQFTWPIAFDPIWIKSCTGYRSGEPRILEE